MLERTIEILGELIAFPTISSDGNLEMIDCLDAKLSTLGARCFRVENEDQTKATLFATLGPEGSGGLVLSGHTDVVPVADQDWTSDPFEMVERDNLLFGRGTCDMKGFIAAALAFAESLDASALNTPLHFSFTYDEETGCLGASQLAGILADKGIRPDMAIIGEPTEMRVIEGHKGCYEYSTEFRGLEGHGSAPDLGVNAAEYAVRYVMRLLELREELRTRAPEQSPFDPPWTTINIGKITGGVAHNVIVGKAEVAWEMRPVTQRDADMVKAEMKALCKHQLLPAMRAVHPEADIALHTVAEVAGLEPMEENAARDLVASLTGANTSDVVAFGTEAGIFQKLGMDCVVCGPGSIAQAHKPDEYIEISQLALCCGMLEKLGSRLTV